MGDRFRFKHLESRGVDVSTEPWRERYQGEWYEPVRKSDQDSPPLAVEAQDGEATLEELTALLRSGKLNREDLVDFGRGWETIEDTPELGELAESLPGRPMGISGFMLFFIADLLVMLVGTPVAKASGHDGLAIAIALGAPAVFLAWCAISWFVALASPKRAPPSLAERRFDPRDRD